MNERWKEMSRRERSGLILELILWCGVILLYTLYFLRILDYNAKTFAWVLFSLTFFASAFRNWNKNRDEAIKMIAQGIFVSIFSTIGLLAFLMTL